MKTTCSGLSLVLLFTVYTSAAFAEIWTQTSAPATNWAAVACSADGTRIAAAAGSCCAGNSGGPIYVSADSGATWTQTAAPILNWSSVASSADGTRFLAAGVDSAGVIYYLHQFWGNLALERRP